MLHRYSIRSILLALCLAPLAWAIQADLAGVVDWHKPLIGEPLLDPAPPRFVDTQAGRRVVALTKSNVLAALNAADGSIGAYYWCCRYYSWSEGRGCGICIAGPV
jgi:hypothetical protein